jgi:hypothetical protein
MASRCGKRAARDVGGSLAVSGPDRITSIADFRWSYAIFAAVGAEVVIQIFGSVDSGVTVDGVGLHPAEAAKN